VAEGDADPLEGDGSDGGAMVLAVLALDIVLSVHPGGLSEGEFGELLQALVEKGRGGPSPERSWSSRSSMTSLRRQWWPW